jgi:hypothetical protein
MQIIIPAVGAQYELEALRMLNVYPNSILITERTHGVETSFDIPLLNGLATKANFGYFLPDNLEGSVLLCDADLFPVVPDPLSSFHVNPDTDVAYVPYPGRLITPWSDYNDALEITKQINSGFIYFKDVTIAKHVSSLWYKKYKERMNQYLSGEVNTDRKGEFDEPSLILVLSKLNYNLELLDYKWNVWDPFQGEEAYFKQQHLNNYIPYEYPDVTMFTNYAQIPDI